MTGWLILIFAAPLAIPLTVGLHKMIHDPYGITLEEWGFLMHSYFEDYERKHGAIAARIHFDEVWALVRLEPPR